MNSSLRILFITGATHTKNDRNFNHFQRVYFLSRWAKLSILSRKGAVFFASTSPGTEVISSPEPGKLGQFFKTMFLLMRGRGKDWDVVITEPSILGICGFFFKIFGRCQWVVDVWDIPIREGNNRNLWVSFRLALVRRMIRLTYRFADFFILSIHPDYEFRKFAIPRHKQMFLSNAIWPLELSDTSITHPKVRPGLSLLCMRSIHTEHMGLDTLAQAFKILEHRHSGISLNIVGKIPEIVKPQVEILFNNPAVQFHDFVPHEELIEMIRATTVCVIPFKDVVDLAQTFPIKVLEYLSLGKLVVASAITGISSMIAHGETGMLFRPGDPESLADSILALANDEMLCKHIRTNLQSLDRKFDCEEKNRQILLQLERLVQLEK